MMVAVTTHERVVENRERYRVLLEGGWITVETLEDLIRDHSHVPHSQEAETLMDDMLDTLSRLMKRRHT